MKAIELFSGRGIIAAALRMRGFSVVTVDIEPPADVVMDVRQFHPAPARFVWGSPPCTEFTRSSLPWHKDFGREPGLDLVREVVRVREEAQAEYWAIENVKGAIPWLRPLLGEPECFGAIVVWHNLPRKIQAGTFFWKESISGECPGDRAQLPFKFAAAVADAVVEACSPALWEV